MRVNLIFEAIRYTKNLLATIFQIINIAAKYAILIMHLSFINSTIERILKHLKRKLVYGQPISDKTECY